jgi:hypothetical protein
MPFSPTLQAALLMIRSERGVFDKSFELVCAVLAEYGEDEQLADRLLADIPTDWPADVIANLFGILVWSTEDNGAAITRTADRWLIEGNDPRKIQIALSLDVFPLWTLARAGAEELLVRISCRFPQFKCECDRWIVHRREAEEKLSEG